MFRTFRARAASPRTRTTRKTAPRTRLWLRNLEDRLVPATFLVNALTDTGTGAGTTGALRFCVLNSGAADTITFDGSVFAVGTKVTLGSSLPVNHDLTFDGTSAGGATHVLIDGNNANAPFNVSSSSNDSFIGLTVQRGKSSSGGAITGAGTGT